MKHAAYAHNLNPVIDWVEATDLEDATNTTDPEKYRRAWDRLYEADGVLVPGGEEHLERWEVAVGRGREA